MMKKEMTLQTATTRSSKSNTTWLSARISFKSIVLNSRPLVSLSIFYSRLLEVPITSLQTLCLLHAQLAFILLVFPVEYPLIARVLFLIWFALSVLQCKRSGLK